MTITNYGFGGEIDAARWAEITSYLGYRYCVRNGASWRPSAVAAERKVAIAGGGAFGHGVYSWSDAPVVLDLPTPTATAGQWHLIFARRTWPVDEGEGTTVITSAPAFPTASAVAGLPPTFVDADGGYLREDFGDICDQPLAWAHVNNANTTVVIQDLRVVRGGGYIDGTPVYDSNWRRKVGEESQTWLKRKDSEVVLKMNLESTAGAIGGRRGQRILTLPRSFRPPTTVAFTAALVDGTAEGVVALAINPDGEMIVLWGSNTSALRTRIEFRFDLTV